MATARREESRVRGNIERRLNAFEEWPTDDASKAGGASRIAEDIARGYWYLGDEERGKEYFRIASEHCATAIDRASIRELRPDQAGHHFFHCARKTWYAGRKEAARRLFLSALDKYQDGYEHELEGVGITCRLYSVFSLIFISNYSSAVENAETAMKLQESSEIPHPGTATPTLKEIAELLAVGNPDAVQSALNRAKEYMSREKITEYGARPHPIVDVKDYILSLLGENGEEAEGPEQAG